MSLHRKRLVEVLVRVALETVVVSVSAILTVIGVSAILIAVSISTILTVFPVPAILTAVLVAAATPHRPSLTLLLLVLLVMISSVPPTAISVVPASRPFPRRLVAVAWVAAWRHILSNGQGSTTRYYI